MGGVLNGASIEEAAVETLRAGSDMFLVCQKEEHVWRAYESVFKRAERDARFAKSGFREGATRDRVQGEVSRGSRSNGSDIHGKDCRDTTPPGVGVHGRVAPQHARFA